MGPPEDLYLVKTDQTRILGLRIGVRLRQWSHGHKSLGRQYMKRQPRTFCGNIAGEKDEVIFCVVLAR